jgi:hypothetical protein
MTPTADITMGKAHSCARRRSQSTEALDARAYPFVSLLRHVGFRALSVAMIVLLAVSAIQATGGSVHGTVRDQSGLPMPGVTITISPEVGEPRIVTTDVSGTFTIDVVPGRYVIKAELAGFETAERRGVVVTDDPVIVDFTLPLAALTDSTRVVAPDAPALVPATAEAPQTVGAEVVHTASLKTGRYDDVLPLLPNVVRGPDGTISVAGARAPQGSLLVNGVRETDPVTGESGVTLPLEAVESVQMNSAAYGAELGGAVSGVTTVQTNAGDDELRVRLNSFTPRFKINHGRITGIDVWEPNFGVSGPIIKNRLWFSQAVDYRFSRDRFDTLLGRQQRRLHAFLSLSQFDARLSDTHTVSTWITIYPETTDAANITAFTTPMAVADAHRGGWSAAVLDRLTIRNTATLETRFQMKRLDASTTPADIDGTYRVAPDRIDGTYFDRRDRTASRTEGSAIYRRTGSWGGRTETLKAGGSFGRVAFDGVAVSQPVEWFRTDGTLARRETFVGDGRLGASASHAAAFVQNDLNVTSRLSVNFGLRVEYNSRASHPVPAPRTTFTYAFADGRTTMSGAAGLYADKLVLAAPAFPGFQDRVQQSFDTLGRPAGAPRTFVNVIDGNLSLPKAFRWNLQLDHRLSDSWVARTYYQERRGKDELIVTPRLTSGTTDEMALSSTGDSRARSFEATIGYKSRSHSDDQVYLSYVRSSSRGNLNDLNAIEGEFKAALVLPDERGPLAADAPHRWLAWGVLTLPHEITLAPFFEWHTGFPYTALDENWTVVGARNTWRYPPFASLDLVATKMVTVPVLHLPARLGVSIFNLTARSDGRDVQRDIERPDFGQTFNPVLRQWRGVFEIVWK